MATASEMIQATGRRKTAIARVRLFKGDGTIQINERTFEDYFCGEIMRMLVSRALVLTENTKNYSIEGTVCGGGVNAQAGAMSHGISRALLKIDPNYRAVLKKEGLLTRDSRMKERKKYGQKGARKKFQFSKR